MRTLAILVLGLFGVVAARPDLKEWRDKQSSLKERLRSLEDRSSARPKAIYDLPSKRQEKISDLREVLRSLEERSSARPKAIYDLPSKGQEKNSDLRQLLMNVVEKYAFRSAEGSSEEDESNERCDEERNITAPCIDLDNDEEFFDCALNEGERAEKKFAEIFKNNNDENEDLFSEQEISLVRSLRRSDLVSDKIKEYTEMMVEEIGYLRFRVRANFEDMSDETMEELLDTQCKYSLVKEEIYRRIPSK